MAKIRVERNKGYTVMSNYHLKDKTITLKSKGLLSMMLSLPDEWRYSTRGLAAICKEGVDAIGAALKELEKAGYIIRNQIRGERGRIVETEYVIYEQPQHKPPPKSPSPETENPPTPADSGLSPHTGFPYMVNPDVENPDTESPDMENPAQYITKESITERENINVSNTQSINPGAWPNNSLYHVPTLPLKETDRLTGQQNIVLWLRRTLSTNIFPLSTAVSVWMKSSRLSWMPFAQGKNISVLTAMRSLRRL